MAHENVGIGGGHVGAHGRAFDLQEMTGVDGEIGMGKELSGWLGVGRALKEMFQGREAMSVGNVSV